MAKGLCLVRGASGIEGTVEFSEGETGLHLQLYARRLPGAGLLAAVRRQWAMRATSCGAPTQVRS